jgi:DNA-binding transcriptional regulator YiaG
MKRTANQRVGKSMADRLSRFADQLERSDHPVEEFSRERFTARKFTIQPPPRITAAKLRSLRESFHASQAVFAKFIGTSPSALRDWEQGTREPNGVALRLFQVMQVGDERVHGIFKDSIARLVGVAAHSKPVPGRTGKKKAKTARS